MKDDDVFRIAMLAICMSFIPIGPYRWIRHPFYSACAIGLVVGSLAMANWFIPLAAGVFWFAFLVPRIKIEERNLLARFGDCCREYMDHTGRYLPKFRGSFGGAEDLI